MLRNLYYAESCCYCVPLRMGCMMIALFELFSAVLNLDYISKIVNSKQVQSILIL